MGTGLMGSAVARHLLKQGHKVTVWNRTYERARHLEQHGAVAHENLGGALDDADAILTVLLDYEQTTDLLAPHAAAMKGRALVNMSTGRPSEAESFAGRAANWGANYLDVAVEAYPEDIGTAHALLNCSGSGTAWHTVEPVMLALGGGAVYVGEKPGTANALDAAMAGAFHNIALGGFLEAIAFVAHTGADPSVLRSSLDYYVTLLGEVLREALDAVEAEDFTTDQVTLDVYLAAVKSWRDSMLEGGARAALMTANMHNLELAQANGHGADSIYSQVTVL
ncbi:NAD(P)-dependent oxidoreductase [Rhodococcus wratislaviensis]|uniref:NAD(P)-dependent oxidoreductase n=1 Tax=Rhodococcus wratislaviensis TaxID=44752 RepID=UPI003513B462